MNGSRATEPDARPSPPAYAKHPLTKLDIHREPQNQLYLSKENSTKSSTRHHKCTGTTPPPPGQRLEGASSARSANRTSAPRARRSESALSTRSASRASAPPDRSMSTTPGGSRLPKRTSYTILEAWRQAELEEDEKERMGSPGGMDASPSPAPRAWRLNKSGDADRRGAQSPSAKDSPARALRTQRSISGIPRRSVSGASQQSSPSASGSPAARRMSDFGKGSPAANFLTKARTGSKSAKTGEGLARRASNSSLNGRVASPAQSKGAKTKAASGWAESSEKENTRPDKGASSAHADVPGQSIEENPDAQPSPSWDALENMSPNKSYAWEMDAEFTAGDLQISDSPRIRFDMNERPPNTKLDEIMEREARDLHDYPAPEGPRPRIFSTRSDEIEELENKIDGFAKPDQDRPRNTLIDDIRAREMEFSSPAAIAASKLEDIRAKNSQFRPRSAEPVPYRPSPDFAQELSRYFDADSESDNGDHWVEGERIPDTPVTIFRKSRQERPSEVLRRARASSDTEDYRSSSTGARDRSTYLSRRRVAPAPGTNPEVDATHGRSDGQQDHQHDTNPEQSTAPPTSRNDPPKSPAPEENNQKGKPTTKTGRDSKNFDNQKPSVGSAELPRASFSKSAGIKKSKMSHSDSDPTERIEREVQLFAPVDTQSDRGSIRVPSPAIPDDESGGKRKMTDGERKVSNGDANAKNDDKTKTDGEGADVEATPRPKRQQNILSMPTPRVTGAYVETPATVKVEPLAEQAKASAIATAPLDEINVVRRRRSYSTSDKGESDQEASRKQARADRTRRRARSLTRHRQPLVNSAKPPTVRDDLIELQKTHNIEDSTLDAFELQEAKDVPESPEIDEMLEGMTDQYDGDVENLGEDGESEVAKKFRARMDKMIEEIRSAKRGIERLETQVSHVDPERKVKQEAEAEVKPEVEEEVRPQPERKAKQEAGEETKSPAPAVAASHLSIPIPRFYRRSPFRLTFSGLLLFALAVWYAAESAVCFNYCRPPICTSPPCVWSLDDPTFGYAIISKVDDWTTGGQGRELSARLSEELSELSADMWDYVTGTDIWSVDPSVLDFEDRKRHRRRLQRKEAAAKRAEPAGHTEKWDAWRAEREAREKANAAMEMGYAFYEESESMNDDAKV